MDNFVERLQNSSMAEEQHSKDQMEMSSKGLLSGYFDLPHYNEEIERRLAGERLAYIESLIEQSGTNLLSCIRVPELKFRRKLILYAVSKRIPLSNQDWEQIALTAIARSHPDFQERRPRGRPRAKSAMGGLLNVNPAIDQEAAEAIRWLDEHNALRREMGKRPRSDRALAKALAKHVGGENAAVVASKMQQFANRMSRTRAILNCRKRPKL